MASKPITTTLPEELIQLIREEALRQERSFSQMIKVLLSKGLLSSTKPFAQALRSNPTRGGGK